jgi:predicted Zn-dependent peptidase
MRNDMPLALDLLSDIILEPRFDRDELERERDVILQEIASAQDSPEDIVFDLVQDAAYPDQPAGRPILGTVESVSALGRDHLGIFLSAHYHAPNMVLVAAGAVDHAALIDEAERRLIKLDASASPAPSASLYRGGLRRGEKSFEQTHLVLGFEGPAYGHPDYYTARILAGVLGGGMSSRLFQEVRERRGLCYAINAFATSLSDSGMIAIYAATGPDRAHELISVLRDELVRAASEGFGEDEIARVRAQAKMGLLAALESSSARAEQLGRQILIYGRPVPANELIEKVESVRIADLELLAGKLLNSPVSLATAGPILHIARFDAVAEKFALASSKAA